MTRHPSVPLTVPGTEITVPVDVAMVNLIRTLWAFGIRTCECCQGDEGAPAYVSFLNSAEAHKFWLWGVTAQHGSDPVLQAVDDWQWQCSPMRSPSVLLWLPHTHVPLLTEAVTRAYAEWATRSWRSGTL